MKRHIKWQRLFNSARKRIRLPKYNETMKTWAIFVFICNMYFPWKHPFFSFQLNYLLWGWIPKLTSLYLLLSLGSSSSHEWFCDSFQVHVWLHWLTFKMEAIVCMADVASAHWNFFSWVHKKMFVPISIS